MGYRVKGTLKLPDGTPANNAEIEFISRKNFSPLVRELKSNVKCGATGAYDVTLEYGEYAVIVYPGGTYPAALGTIILAADTVAGQDLPTLLQQDGWQPATPEYVQQIQVWLSQADKYAQDAKQSADDAASTLSSTVKKDALTSFGGELDPAAAWSCVPAHSDAEIDGPLNAQAGALAARTKLLRTGVSEALRRSYAEVGYNLVAGSFEAGGTLVNVNDALLHESSGLAYKWGGAFQKVVPPKSTPATTGGVSSAGWLSLGDITLRDEVQQRLDTADANTAAFKANNGFNLVGRFLNLTTLKSALPTTAGDIVFVASAASTTASETHYGGGFFQSVARTGTDDGGVAIQPATGDFMWRRIGFDVPELVFWGVKPDTGMNNAPEILKAMTYVRSKKCTIKFPAGVITSNEALPIWSESSIIGQGRSVTRFIKLTNNLYQVAPGVGVDALCVCLPDKYDPSGYTMDTFCVRPNIKGISLERVSTTYVNKPYYGIWGHKLAGAHFSDMLVLGGYFGFYGINCFLMIQEQMSYSGVTGSFAGVYIANDLTGSYGRSGTTCNFTQVGVGGYNYGFFIAGLDSTRLTQCDVEAISSVSGETQCVGYAWINPMNCTMANCYTEDVDGPQLTVINANAVSIANSLVVDNFNMTPPRQAFTQATPLMKVDAAGLGPLKVTFVGGDLRFAVAGTNNMTPPEARGANCKVTILGGFTNAWSALAGGVVTEL